MAKGLKKGNEAKDAIKAILTKTVTEGSKDDGTFVDNTPNAAEKIKEVKNFFNAEANKKLARELKDIHAAVFNPSQVDDDKVKSILVLLDAEEVVSDEDAD